MIKDEFGEEILPGDIILRAVQSNFVYHVVERISNSGKLVVRRIKNFYGNPLKPVWFYDNPKNIEEAKKCKKEGLLYLSGYAGVIKIESNKINR